MRRKLSQIEQESGLDSDELLKLIPARVLNEDPMTEFIDQNVAQTVETGELRQAWLHDGTLSPCFSNRLNSSPVAEEVMSD